MPRQLLDRGMSEGPDRQGVDVLADHPREVGDALAAPHADVLVAEEDRAAAELRDRRLEADPRPQRRLLEDQAQRPPRQVQGALPLLVVALQLGGALKQVAGRIGRQLEQVDEMADHRGTLLGVAWPFLLVSGPVGWRGVASRRSLASTVSL